MTAEWNRRGRQRVEIPAAEALPIVVRYCNRLARMPQTEPIAAELARGLHRRNALRRQVRAA